jgi:hypothetical protein
LSRNPARRFVWIPDTQVKPGVPTDHIEWAARYIAEKQPSVIVVGGDWHDMPSLSSYDRGKRSSEGKRYRQDIQAGNDAIDLFERTLKREAPKYQPGKEFILGNHDGPRIERAIDDAAWLEGAISVDDLGWKRHGWRVHPLEQH